MEYFSDKEWKLYPVNSFVSLSGFYSLFLRSCACGYDFPGETHDFWECLYVVRGGVCVSGDDRIYRLSEGDIIFHKPLELHKFYVDGEDGADILVFSFEMQGTVTEYVSDKAYRLNARQKTIISEFMSYLHTVTTETTDHPSVGKVRWYIDGIERKPFLLPMTEAYIRLLLLTLAEESEPVELFASSDSCRFSDAVNYMKANVYDNPGVEEVANACSTSVSTLKRIFEKYAGISVHKYFLKLKLKKAIGLLSSGVNVSDTAQILGFSSQAYFTKAFCREIGSNPSDFKK